MSGFDDYRDLCEERDQLRAELEASRRELFAYQADVEGANRRELSFATACVRNVEGITVGGALEMQRDEIASLRAELAELRARVPAICFPRQPNGEDGWVIDANYVAAIHKDCFPIEWQPCEEEVEAVLLAVERAAPVTPAAVPEDVAKYRHHLELLRDDCTYPAGHVGAVVLNGHRMEIIRDALAAILAKIDASKGEVPLPLSALVCVGRARFPRTGGNAGISWHVEDALSDTGGFRSGNPCNGELLFVLPATAKRAMLAASGRQDGAR